MARGPRLSPQCPSALRSARPSPGAFGGHCRLPLQPPFQFVGNCQVIIWLLAGLYRLTMDYLHYGEPRALFAVDKINTWIKSKTDSDPDLIVNGYTLAGAELGTDPDLPFVASFGVAAMLKASNQAWLNSLWNSIVAVPVNDGDYFGNTIKMLSLIVMSGNAWKP